MQSRLIANEILELMRQPAGHPRSHLTIEIYRDQLRNEVTSKQTIRCLTTWECPNRRSRSARSPATSLSRRPPKGTFRISSYVASAAAPAAARCASSAASFTARSIGSPAVRETYEVPGSACWSASRCSAHALSLTPKRPARVEEGRGGRVGVLAVGPVAQRQGGRARRVCRVLGLQGGDHEDRVLSGGQYEQGEALGDRGGRVSGEPDEVGSGCHQEPGEPRVLGRPGGAPHPGPVVVGGEGRGPGCRSSGPPWKGGGYGQHPARMRVAARAD